MDCSPYCTRCLVNRPISEFGTKKDGTRFKLCNSCRSNTRHYQKTHSVNKKLNNKKAKLEAVIAELELQKSKQQATQNIILAL